MAYWRGVRCALGGHRMRVDPDSLQLYWKYQAEYRCRCGLKSATRVVGIDLRERAIRDFKTRIIALDEAPV